MAYFQDRKSWEDNEKWPNGIVIINFHFSFGKIISLLKKAKEKYILINLFENGPHKKGPPEFSKSGIPSGAGSNEVSRETFGHTPIILLNNIPYFINDIRIRGGASMRQPR